MGPSTWSTSGGLVLHCIARTFQKPSQWDTDKVGFGSYVRLAVQGGYGLLEGSQGKLQNFLVDLSISPSDAQTGPNTNEVQFLRDLSEINIDIGQSRFSVRPWLKDNMSGHDFRKSNSRAFWWQIIPNRISARSRTVWLTENMESVLISQFTKSFWSMAISWV